MSDFAVGAHYAGSSSSLVTFVVMFFFTASSYIRLGRVIVTLFAVVAGWAFAGV